jgi:uncharacterized membrane protein
MVENGLFALKVATALGCGLIGGVFFAFSAFVMAGLGRLPPAQGIAAMQSINVTAVTPLFMLALFGTAAACLFLVIWSVPRWNQPGVPYLLVGSVLYLIGAILVTIVFNVPRNDALAGAKPDSPEAAQLWATYLTTWIAWNHVRTLASLAAAAAITLSLCQRATP